MKTVILHYKTALQKEEKEKLEKEYSEKLKANVVILDARFDDKVIEF